MTSKEPLLSLRREDPKYRAGLERLVWKYTHADFKSKRADGTKVVNHNEHDGTGTCSVELSSLSVEKLYAKLPNAVIDRLVKEVK